MKFLASLLCMILIAGCQQSEDQSSQAKPGDNYPDQYILVLGIAQDGGFPQAGCNKSCCTALHKEKIAGAFVTSLAIVDQQAGKQWIIDATPDFPSQLYELSNHPGLLEGILLTHGHIGHYTGLMHLGHEVMGVNKMAVYAMPRMSSFLESNGPWSQLVEMEQIVIKPITEDSIIQLSNSIAIKPFLVPHRDEFTETVGYEVVTSAKKVLFIPDIDKWSKWEIDINERIKQVNIAFVDGTFYENGEITDRDMSKIPHPFIVESMDHFQELSETDKDKIHFIHLNHTNPVLLDDSPERLQVINKGYQIAYQGQVAPL